jgi:hypothetical protein
VAAPAPDTHAAEAVDLNLAGPGQPLSIQQYTKPPNPWDERRHRGETAQRLANTIVYVFAGSLALLFLLGGTIVVASETPEEAKQYVAIILPFLDGVANFATTVFASLLAFVFGYYFSESRR